MARARDLHGRQQAESPGERHRDGGAGRRGQLHRRTLRIDRGSDEEARGSGSGDGQEAVLGVHRAAADVHRRAVHLGDVELVKGDAGADDIGDGIDGADLVEMDFLDRDVVDAASASPSF